MRPIFLAAALLAACTAGTDELPDAGQTPDAGTSPTDGTGTATGKVNGNGFGDVKQALVIGQPDDASTTVVFLFSNPVTCADLGASGWDEHITDATKLLGLKLFGKAPGDYGVVTTHTLGAADATASFTVSSQAGIPISSDARGGTITLGARADGGHASGTFHLTFGADTLDGSFDAAFCAGGHEP